MMTSLTRTTWSVSAYKVSPAIIGGFVIWLVYFILVWVIDPLRSADPVHPVTLAAGAAWPIALLWAIMASRGVLSAANDHTILWRGPRLRLQVARRRKSDRARRCRGSTFRVSLSASFAEKRCNNPDVPTRSSPEKRPGWPAAPGEGGRRHIAAL